MKPTSRCLVLLSILLLAACAPGPRTPLAGGDASACIATCNRLALECREQQGRDADCRNAAPHPAGNDCPGEPGDPARDACVGRQLACELGQPRQCDVRRDACVQSCGI